jgi:hypothetical protein
MGNIIVTRNTLEQTEVSNVASALISERLLKGLMSSRPSDGYIKPCILLL